MSPPRAVVSGAPRFEYTASREFLRELAKLAKTDPEGQQIIIHSMSEILTNPYEPALVKKCVSVSAKNFRYALTINGTKSEVLTMEWTVKRPRSVGSLSISSEVWDIAFLAITVGELPTD